MNNKKALFEYFVLLIYKWYCEANNLSVVDRPNNDLSKLKVIKLHFFACSTSRSALSIFDSFYAMPYGHVERDVYDFINDLNYFRITNSCLYVINNINSFNQLTSNLNIDDKLTIENAVNSLKKYNYNIITYTAFDLVELSHKWFSWKFSFENAKKVGLMSSPIEKSLILTESKIYAF